MHDGIESMSGRANVTYLYIKKKKKWTWHGQDSGKK